MARKIVKRRQGESIVIGNVVVEVSKGSRLVVHADKQVPIWRGEQDPERMERIKRGEARENEGCQGVSSWPGGSESPKKCGIGRDSNPDD